MAWTKVWAFIDKHIGVLGSLLFVLVAAVTVTAHFIRPFEDLIVRDNLWSVLIIGLMVVVLDHLVKIHPAPPKPVLELCESDDKVHSTLDSIAASRPKKADLIEYSAHTIQRFLGQLCDSNCVIRLLVQHPDSAPNQFQADRIRVNLANMAKVTFENYNRVEIRCYRMPASIRARCFDDDQVIIGWYRYVRGGTGVAGHTNPMIAAIGPSPESRELVQWFRKVFDELWDHPDTVKAATVSLEQPQTQGDASR